MKHIPEVPARLRQHTRLIDASGGTHLALYERMEEWAMRAITEFPDAESPCLRCEWWAKRGGSLHRQ